MKELINEWRKYVREVSEIKKDNLVVLNEEDGSTWDKLKYLPANFFSAIERKIRKETGIRGVMDPSVVADSDGNLIMPKYSKMPEWQKKNPEAYAALQTAANLFASDPFTLASWFVGGGAVKGAAGVATKGLGKLSPELANIASKELPSLGKVASSLEKDKASTPINVRGRSGSSQGYLWRQVALPKMIKNKVPVPVQNATATLYDMYIHGLASTERSARALGLSRVKRGFNAAINSTNTSEAELRAYQQFLDTIQDQYVKLDLRFTKEMLEAVNDKLLRIYSDPKLAPLRLDPKSFSGATYTNNGGIHNFHLLPQEELPKLKDVITGTHMVDWSREIPRVVKTPLISIPK